VSTAGFRRFPAAVLAEQARALLSGWGFPPEMVAAAADALVDADLMGIDSHGTALLPIYRQFLDDGRFNKAAAPRVERETPASALLDGDGALGQWPATLATDLAVAKARQTGLAAVAVHGSNHFGAAGFYARRAAEQGFVALVASNVFSPAIVPTGGRIARFGTNPLAFAAPAGRHRPFLFDMATSTVALGRVKKAAWRGERVPFGWVLGPDGQPTDDPDLGWSTRLATPLGGTPELSSHKGTGLAAMVEILGGVLARATLAPLRQAPSEGRRPGGIGHFFLLLDPGLFGPPETFRDLLDEMIDALRATPPIDPAQPVLVAGDPEYAARDERERAGVPLPNALVDALRGLAEEAGVPFLLEEGKQ